MDPTRNPAEDADFDFDAWVRWQNLTNAWQHVSAARYRDTQPQAAVPAPAPAPETVYLLPVPN